MPPKNKLLGSGKVEVEEKIAEAVVAQHNAPAWRYHQSCLAGRIVKTDAELAVLDAAGWKDHPGKVQKLPGHEHLFEE